VHRHLLQVHVDRKAEAEAQNTDGNAEQQQIVTANPVKEGHLRQVRKLEVCFAPGTVLRISWDGEGQGCEGGAQTNCDTPKYVFHH
jgi:hypothetical protein